MARSPSLRCRDAGILAVYESFLMIRIRFPLFPITLALLAGACAPAAQRTYVAPTRETIVSTTEEHEANPPSHLIYIENHSTVPVTVFSLSLTGCDNIKLDCGPHPVRLNVHPDSRVLALRVEPRNPNQAWNYSFGFSWHVDSAGAAALTALAQAGDSSSRVRLAAMEREDSIRKAEGGAYINELSRTDFAALKGRVATMRAIPESLVIAPGTHTSIDQIKLVLVDAQGNVLGRTRWVRWFAPGGGAIQFVPPSTLLARRPGRAMIRFNLADDAQQLLGTSLGELQYPLIAAYPVDPHAPIFEGRALDADTKKPLACVAVALEDSAQNAVAHSRSGTTGTFFLTAPRPGTYRVRIETVGWAPVYGPSELAGPDADKQHEYVVRFSDQMIMSRFARADEDMQHAQPLGVTRTAGNKLVQHVSLGGSDVLPIINVVGSAPVGTIWAQFAVDSAGRVDSTSVSLPATANARQTAAAKMILPRVRFNPAMEAGKPVCELLRMQLNFSGR
jgi:hypothetical protein